MEERGVTAAQNAEMKRYIRKQYLVAKRFQLKYVGLILLLMFATAALCSYVVYYTSMILLGEKLANVYPQGRLVSIVKIVNFRILLSVLLVTPLVAILGVFLSHRIAGPIYRMEKFLNDLAAGNLASRITLRAKDELLTLANGINIVAESFKVKVTAEREHLKKIAAELERLEKAAGQGAAKDSVKIIKGEVNSLTKTLDIYKI